MDKTIIIAFAILGTLVISGYSDSPVKDRKGVVDVDRIVKERDVTSVDHYISTVIQYILEDEQAKVLDTNFVKIFRISQLAVEYLLFCKKYLDNTVVLLKKELGKNREENKELKAFVDDLQSHIETLTKQQAIATFKCFSCHKVFSSEEYLNAHIKRRHYNENNESYNLETDKLNLEIKELKERLNNTEKLLKEKEDQDPEKINEENSKITEILESFEKFKNQIDGELKELKSQKTFYEENYCKLFDIVIQNKENVEPKNQVKEIPKTETTTQTDKLLRIENVNNKNVVEIQEPVGIDPPQTEKESIDGRISTTLAGIEDQMQAFWNRLSEIEQNKPSEIGNNISVEEVKPKAKPRSKLSQPTHIVPKTTNNADRLKIAIEELERQQKDDEVETKKLLRPESRTSDRSNETINRSEEVSSSEESDSSAAKSSSEESVQNKKILLRTSEFSRVKVARSSENSPKPAKSKEVVTVKPPLTNLGKHSHTRSVIECSPKKTSSKKTIAHLNKEIKTKVCSRLHELGISENWTRLPEKSFGRALEIINHQATLTKKTFPSFNSIKKALMADVEKQCSKKLGRASDSPKVEKTQNIVRVSYRPKSGRKSVVHSPQRETVEIKNRALYETDTESEQNFQHPSKNLHASPNIKQSHQWYSNVIDELKSLPNQKLQTDEDSTDEINKDAQKGVLKSFPSVGSLSKKKVLFDLENDSRTEEPPVIQKTGGSTTSIASSILGDKVETSRGDVSNKEKLNALKNIEKDLDELSDFDLSDL